jgi:peptide/nickel transport system substrate-binding protein
MTDQRYRADRRRFLRDSALVSIGLVAAACAPGTTPAASGGTGKKGGEFHAAWPWDLPPKGHYNYLNSTAILFGGYLTDFFIPSLGVYRWADGKWENWLMESAAQNGENYEVKLKQGLKWDDGKDFTSADVATSWRLPTRARCGSTSTVPRASCRGSCSATASGRTRSSARSRSSSRIFTARARPRRRTR